MQKIIEMLSEGYGYTDIAKDLYLKRNTVSQYVYALEDRFSAQTVPHLIAILFREGIIK